MELQKTSLHKNHLELGAKMAPFAGFDMPVQYSSIKEEVLAVRNKVGVFDVSHMGEFFVTGPDAIPFVDYIITNDFKNAEMNKAVYSPLCRENGTVIDDLIAYKLSPQNVLICVNAGNIEKDWNWINANKSGFNITITNESSDFSLIALQGPESAKILQDLGVLNDLKMPYYSVYQLTNRSEEIILARTGYTGEDGFEIFAGHDYIAELWQNLLTAKVTPCGLASRDVLRLEVCFPLYGHELNDEITPLDANLGWTVKMSKEKFIGKMALTNLVSKKQLVKLSIEKGIPREGHKILNSEDQEIGVVTSGSMSVISGRGIALAHVERAQFPKDKKFKINIRKNNLPAEYHTKAFVTGGHK